jgi:carboxylesterase
MDLSQTFQGPEHQAFFWEGGKRAALLVHGFPGTPAEMRPLGTVLNRAGWSVQGILLPGFGPQLETLAQRRHCDWLAAVHRAVNDLRRNHDQVLLAGFSMGAALALSAAPAARPDGLLLLSPFWTMSGPLWKLLPLFRRVLPAVRPFRLLKIDFSDPEMRKGMATFLPHPDLDDSEVQQGIRDFAVPISIFDELRQVGHAAWRAAPLAQTPTTILQGTQDGLVTPYATRKLLRRLNGPLTYIELEAAHDLLNTDKPSWPHVQRSVLAFTEQLARVINLITNKSGAQPYRA